MSCIEPKKLLGWLRLYFGILRKVPFGRRSTREILESLKDEIPIKNLKMKRKK